MSYSPDLAGRFRPALLWPALAALFLSGCGLGLDTQARIERAETALANGEYRAAIIDAKNVLLDEPENVTARVLLGRASLAVGDAASAEKELRRAIGLGASKGSVVVDLGRALVLLGNYDDVLEEVDLDLVAGELERSAAMRVRADALLGLQRTDEARDLYSEVLNSDQSDIEAYLGIVRTYVADRNPQQAREVLHNALQQDDAFIPSWLLSGSLAMRTGDLERAIMDFGHAAELAAQSGDEAREMAALAGQADAELARQDIDAARATLDRMAILGERDTRTLLVSSRIAAADREWGSAQESLQEVLRRMPEHRQAQMLLGYVHKESGNLRQAEMYLSAVVSAIPGNAQARRMLAETRLMLDKGEAAREALNPLLEDTAPGGETLSMAAAASLSLDDFEGAITFLERSAESDPNNVPLKIQLAFAFYRAGEPQKAQAVLEAIPAGAYEGIEFQRDSLLIMSMMAQGDRDSALQEARALQARTPNVAAVHTLVGVVEMSMGDYGAARRSLNEASRIGPDDVSALHYLAQLDILEGDPQSASERYELVHALTPDDVGAMLALAEISVRSENLEAARQWLEKARSADSEAVVPRRILGSILLASREFAAAEEVLSEALDLESDEARLHEMMGFAKLNQRFFRDAEASFSRAMVLQPETASHRYNVARSQVALGNKASAITTLRDSREQSMSHLPSAALLASILADTGKMTEAMAIVEETKRRFPDDAIVHALEGELQARGGDLDLAVEAYDRALNMDMSRRVAIRAFQVRNKTRGDDAVEPLVRYLASRPLDTGMRAYLGQAYQQRGEIELANAEYQQVLENDPDNFIAANNLAWNYYEQGDSRAEEAARRAYDIEPNSGSVADTLGWILVEKGALKEGIEILQKADELSEGDAEVRYHLAAALAADGQIGSAKNMLQELLESGAEFADRDAAEKLLSTL